MTVSPIRDYSDALIPLPPLNGAGPASSTTSPAQTENRSFMDILGPLVDSPEDREGIRPGVATGSLFDLGGSVSSPDAASYPLSSAYSGGSTGNLLNQSAESGDQEDRLTDACRDLEGFLLGMLLRNLGKSFGGSNLFSQTWESSFYQSMFFFELAQAICAQGPGLGIAEQIKNDIIMKTGEVS